MNRFGGLALLGPYLKPYRGRTILALLSLLVAAGTPSKGPCAGVELGCYQSRETP